MGSRGRYIRDYMMTKVGINHKTFTEHATPSLTLCRASAPPRHLVFLAASRIDHKSSKLEHWGRGYGQVQILSAFHGLCLCVSLVRLEVVQATLSRIGTITYTESSRGSGGLSPRRHLRYLLLAPYVTRKLWFHGLLAMK
jgi:hypothetical protein